MGLTQVNSNGLKDDSIVNADIKSDAAIAGSKLVAATTSVPGAMSAADKTKLDGIEASATINQTPAQIRAAVEAATDSNVFTDADHTKLNAIEAGATTDQTAAEIRTLVESASDSNVFTNANLSKLNGIEAAATTNQTDAEIRAAVEAASDSNVFTDADHSKLNGIATSATANPSAPALTGSTNNTITTVTGANAIQGEASLTYDGTILEISNATPKLKLTDSDATGTPEAMVDGSGGDLYLHVDKDDEKGGSLFGIKIDGDEKLRIASDGGLFIGSTGSRPDPTTAGFKVEDSAGSVRWSRGGGTSGTTSAGLTLFGGGSGTNTAATTAWGTEVGLVNTNSTDGNSNCIYFANSNQSSTSSIVGQNVSHSGRTGDLVFQTASGSAPVERFRINSSGHLVHSKFETYSSGVKTYGGYLRIVGDEGGVAQLDLYADEGDDAYDIWQVKAGGSSDFSIAGWNGGAYEKSLNATGNGGVELYFDNSKKLETTTDGVVISNGSLYLGDYSSGDGYIGLGADQDLQLWHDGSNSYIKAYEGDLYITAHSSADDVYLVSGSEIRIMTDNSNESSIVCTTNAGVELHYDGSKKFETSSYGATLSNTSKVTFAGDDNRYIDFEGNSNNRTVTFRSRDGGAEDSFAKFIANGGVELYYNNSKKLETWDEGCKGRGIVHAFGMLDGTPGTIHLDHDFGCGALTDNGSGDYTVALTNALLNNSTCGGVINARPTSTANKQMGIGHLTTNSTTAVTLTTRLVDVDDHAFYQSDWDNVEFFIYDIG